MKREDLLKPAPITQAWIGQVHTELERREWSQGTLARRVEELTGERCTRATISRALSGRQHTAKHRNAISAVLELDRVADVSDDLAQPVREILEAAVALYNEDPEAVVREKERILDYLRARRRIFED